MLSKQQIIFLVLALVITAVVFFSPFSIDSVGPLSFHCRCGGCCVGCPGDCNSIGTPFTFYYWGTNDLSGEVVSQFAVISLFMDAVVWALLILIAHSLAFILARSPRAKGSP